MKTKFCYGLFEWAGVWTWGRKPFVGQMVQNAKYEHRNDIDSYHSGNPDVAVAQCFIKYHSHKWVNDKNTSRDYANSIEGLEV